MWSLERNDNNSSISINGIGYTTRNVETFSVTIENWDRDGDGGERSSSSKKNAQ